MTVSTETPGEEHMKCTNCETTLTGALDTYGPLNSPQCRSCFLAGDSCDDGPAEFEEEIKQFDDEICELEREINRLEGELFELKASRRKALSEQQEQSRQAEEARGRNGRNATALI
jgi:hypothetical protein